MYRPNGILLAAGLAVAVLSGIGVAVAQGMAETIKRASFTSDGQAMLPEGWRQWVFVGSPLTPNALNGGEAAFPEFHNVYIEPSAFAHYRKTGEFAEGTQIVKELVSVRGKPADEMYEDGSTDEVSGRGFFNGGFIGFELLVKDSARFPDRQGGWGFFSFAHNAPPPYPKTASVLPVETCNACHDASAATDSIFTQFYPILQFDSPQ